MYKIIKKDTVLGIVSNLTGCVYRDSSCYGLTIRTTTESIALNGTMYHVNGHLSWTVLGNRIR